MNTNAHLLYINLFGTFATPEKSNSLLDAEFCMIDCFLKDAANPRGFPPFLSSSLSNLFYISQLLLTLDSQHKVQGKRLVLSYSSTVAVMT